MLQLPQEKRLARIGVLAVGDVDGGRQKALLIAERDNVCAEQDRPNSLLAAQAQLEASDLPFTSKESANALKIAPIRINGQLSRRPADEIFPAIAGLRKQGSIHVDVTPVSKRAEAHRNRRQLKHRKK